MSEISYRREQPVVAHVGDVPVYSFGQLFIQGVCPDFYKDLVIQEGNRSPKVKIKPKRSWEITENYIGACSPRMPRSASVDFQPYLWINLIDGNPETVWCSRGQSQPDAEPVWIRVDLAFETKIREIVLVPVKPKEEGGWEVTSLGSGLPQRLLIRVSRDAWHWTTVFKTRNLTPPRDGEPIRIPLTNPLPAKQVWIIGKTFPDLGGYLRHCFNLAEVEVIDEKGENVALASRGGAATVSSTQYGLPCEREVHEMLWPIHWDLGLKWIRVAYAGATLNWQYVEQEKGKYVIDPRTDDAVTESVENGCNVFLCLGFGNWLYVPEPRKITNVSWHNSCGEPPVTSAMKEGYRNFVRFMVHHFKDRIHYYEVWNEPNLRHQWNVKQYCDLVKEVAPIIREEDPKAKVVLGAQAGIPWSRTSERRGMLNRWLYDCLDENICGYVDVLSWHSQCMLSCLPDVYRDYPKLVRDFQKEASARGFKGEYMVTEYHDIAPYPPSSEAGPHPDDPRLDKGIMTEIQQAKHLARMVTMHRGLSSALFWCETWNNGMTAWMALGLLRNTWSSNPINAVTDVPAYYVMRTMCTLMDCAEPAELEVELSERSFEFDNYNFARPGNEWLVAVWLHGHCLDDSGSWATPRSVKTDVVVKNIRANQISCIDTLNGVEQKLEWRIDGNDVVVPNLLIRDYPFVLKLKG